MELPSVSIIIPTFNEEAFLPDLLHSLKSQTLRPLEVIVADAHSTDRTRQIAEEAGANVVDGGMPGPGRNRGAEVAKGDILVFFDADVNLTDPTFLEKAVREMEERGIDMGAPDVIPLSDGWKDRVGHGFYNWYVRKLEKIHPHAPGFAMFVRRWLHEKIGGFDETVTFCEDHDYAMRAHKVGNFRFLSLGIPTSTRRMERDGHVNIAIKYILAEIYIWIFGPIRNNLFNYTFGHKGKE